MPDISRQCRRDSTLRNEINDMLEAWNIFQEKLQSFSKYAEAVLQITDIETLQGKLALFINNISGLRSVLRYRNLRSKVTASGWGKVVDLMENSPSGGNFLEIYDLLFFRNMLNQILEK